MKYIIASCALVVLACITITTAQVKVNNQMLFDYADKDNNTYLTEEEFTAFYESFDHDDDKQISIAEFMEHFMFAGMCRTASLYLFHRVDADMNQQFSMDEVKGFYHVVDSDKDTYINFAEFASLNHAIESQTDVGERIAVGAQHMFEEAAKTNSSFLISSVELSAVFSPAETDGSLGLSKAEFVAYWRNRTGDNEERASRLFDFLNFQSNATVFGSEEQQKFWFDTLDHNKDSMVTLREFLDALIFMYAGIMEDVDERTALSMTGSTFDIAEFFKAVEGGDDKMSMEENMKALDIFDTDRDGALNYTEYLTAAAAANFSVRGALYRFFMEDKNHDDVVDASEMRMVFHETDRNRDNFITEDEFTYFFKRDAYNIMIVASAFPKVHAMLANADMNGDDSLNGVEMWAVVSPSDENHDGALTSAEFVKYWNTHTGLDVEISTRLFDIWDSDRDGVIEEAERTEIYQTLDYGKDGYISFDEFMSVMLFNYAEIIGDIDAKIRTYMQGRFNMTEAFDMIDTDKDGDLSMKEYLATIPLMDIDGDGVIAELEYVIAQGPIGLPNDGASYLFTLTDANDDGGLTAQELEAGIAFMDLNDDDSISRREFDSAWRGILYQLSETSDITFVATQFFNYADGDKDHKLTVDEFETFRKLLTNSSTVTKDELANFWTGIMVNRERAEMMFDLLDEDKDGILSEDEQEKLFKDLSMHETHDQKISITEFQHGMIQICAKIFQHLEVEEWTAKIQNAVVG